MSLSGLDVAALERWSESVVAIVRAPLGNGAAVFAPNIKLGLFPRRGRSPLEEHTALYVNRSPLECAQVLFTLT